MEVKSQYEAQTKMNPGEFQAVLVRTQVVAGLNYLFKVFTGEDTYSHLKVFKPLPYTNEEPVLEGYLLNMTMDDELEDFGDENGVEACS
ncbi:cystatin-A1-like isoform X2 [Aquarana catesbeiana]|uniref:cystatin-A1-like isoform X2 n=1 Tax=Aquarana catesbeiana TaxID=8400 RepID=UPI003CCA266B